MNLNAIRLAPSLGYISAYRQADAETSVHWLVSSSFQVLRNPRRLANGCGNVSMPQLLQILLHLNVLVCLVQQADGMNLAHTKLCSTSSCSMGTASHPIGRLGNADWRTC